MVLRNKALGPKCKNHGFRLCRMIGSGTNVGRSTRQAPLTTMASVVADIKATNDKIHDSGYAAAPKI